MFIYIYVQPPKPASLRDARFAALCGGAGLRFLGLTLTKSHTG